MRTITRSIQLIFCILLTNIASGQDLRFNSTKFDFGSIAEDGGTVSHIFEFENSSSTPIVIITANTSCGCTVPEYSRKPIAKGERSEVKVTYDPMYRPGAFSKTITIVTSSSDDPYVLTISGDVTPRTKSVEEEFPYDMGGGLRFATNYYALSQVEQDSPKESLVSYINTSTKPIKLELRPEVSSGYLTMDAPVTIAPQDRGSFAIRYSVPQSSGYYGTLSDKSDVVIDGKRSKYQLLVSGHAVDKFRENDINIAPDAYFDKRFIKFAEIVRNRTTPKNIFRIENTGLSDLTIRAIEGGKGTQLSIKAGDIVKAGESLDVEVWVDTDGFELGPFSQYITLTTNDPKRPIQRLRVTGIVVK